MGSLLLLSLCGALPASHAETLVVSGAMRAAMRVEITQTFDTTPGTLWLQVSTPRVVSVRSRSTAQEVVDYATTYGPAPISRKDIRDAVGNVIEEVVWEKPVGVLRTVSRLTVRNTLDLTGGESTAGFPLGSIPQEVRPFLEATAHTQSDSPAILAQATRLAAGARSQREAVARILNFVVDHIRYKLEPERHDAVFVLQSGTGNCTGYSQLSIALLRAVGIPARMVAGITLATPWPVAMGSQTLIQKVGQGRHAWIEVWFPDLGWLPYDPQSLHMFVSSFHIRHLVGRDLSDTNRWYSYTGAQPKHHQAISATILDEGGALRSLRTETAPRSYIMAADLRFREAGPPLPPLPPPIVGPPAPPIVPPAAVPGRAELTEPVEFGNLEFPAALRIFQRVPGPGPGQVNEVRWTLVSETAEYATGPQTLAQAFRVERPLLLADVALALQKFGGTTGALWLELRPDAGQGPGAPILAESQRSAVRGILGSGGYRWLVFDFNRMGNGPILVPGRYWVVLRHSGDGIFNWYFTPGTAYGDPDDSRARPAVGTRWDTILNYRFNFRVSGLGKP